MKFAIRQLIDKSALMLPIYRLREKLLSSARQEQKNIIAELQALHGGQVKQIEVPQVDSNSKTVILVGGASIPMAALQAPFIIGARMAGFKALILLSSPSQGLEKAFISFGASDFIFLNAYLAKTPSIDMDDFLKGTKSIKDIIDKTYLKIHCGKFALSTFLRRNRSGRVDFSNAETLIKIRPHLENSCCMAEAMQKIVSRYKPALVAFYDRGYTPEGELFDAALQTGARAITMNSAHRGGLQLYKKYGPHNADKHPAALSEITWQKMTEMEWDKPKWDTLFNELKNCYTSGQWYDEVGTQFGKKNQTKDEIVTSLGLDPTKKTAVVFAHIFWDATFFWGEDLFEDYEDWFVQSLQAAAKNTNLNWIFKTHPANLVKDQRDGYKGERVESTAIKNTLGELPDHIKLIEPEHEVSTFSLFESIDYCLTVRGTVGMEAASFGIPVITAGTGRYDQLGFTHDHENPEAYLDTLSHLENIEPMSDDEIELARRYLYAVLIKRPLLLETIKFEYCKDSTATLKVTLNNHGLSPDTYCDDVIKMRDWLLSNEDDLCDWTSSYDK